MDAQAFYHLAKKMLADHGYGNVPVDMLPFAGSGDASSIAVTAFNPNDAVTAGHPVRFGFTSDYVMFMDEDEAKSTILHEIAHADVGHSHEHDSVWSARSAALGSKSVSPTYKLRREDELTAALSGIDPVSLLLSQFTGKSPLGAWVHDDPAPWPANMG